MDYQAPHVAVRQQFTPAAPAVIVSNLPHVVYGPAFNVYEKEDLGIVDGINNAQEKLPWIGEALEKAIYNNIDFDADVYNRFSVKVFLKAAGETIARLVSSTYYTKDAVGLLFSGEPTFPVGSDEDQAGGAQGTDTGFMPYAGGTITTSLGATDKLLTDTNADFITAKIQAGQTVNVAIDAGGDAAITVRRVKSATELELNSTPGIATSGNAYTVGSNSSSGTAMEDFFDLSGTFKVLDVKVGDLLKVVSNQGLGSMAAPAAASVKQVLSDVWVKICIEPVNQIDPADLTKLNTLVGDAGLSAVTQTTAWYSIERYFYKGIYKSAIKYTVASVGSDDTITLPTDWAAAVDGTQVKIDNITTGLSFVCAATVSGADITLTPTGLVSIGDNVIVYIYKVPAADVVADKTKITIVDAGAATVITAKQGDKLLLTFGAADPEQHTVASVSGLEITVEGPGIQAAIADTITSVEFFNGLKTYSSDAFVDYRGAKTGLAGQVINYTSIDEIIDTVGDSTKEDGGINEYNDIAYMAWIAFTSSGQKRGYMALTDGSAPDEAIEYATAKQAMTFKKDAYAQALATYDSSVNASMGPYCDAQAEPYQGQERVAYLAYKFETIMEITTGAATSGGTGELNDSGATFIDDGVSINDIVILTIDDEDVETAVKAIGGQTNLILKNTTLVVTAADTYIIRKGNKSDQANAIKAISESLENRRITHVWSGDFEITDDRFGTRILPGWFACASVAGQNSVLHPAQGMTNMPIPGPFNNPRYSNDHFEKGELDIIASGGTFILTQEVPGATLKCRHQLTTRDDSPKTGEDSVRRQIDVGAKTTRAVFSIYVGKYNISNEFVEFLFTVAGGVKKSLLTKKIIRNLQILNMKENPDRVDGIIAKVRITAYYPVNVFDITLIV